MKYLLILWVIIGLNGLKKERYTRGHKVTGYSDSRHLRRTGQGGYRGKIVAEHFFQSARADEESFYNSMMASITESLNRIQ